MNYRYMGLKEKIEKKDQAKAVSISVDDQKKYVRSDQKTFWGIKANGTVFVSSFLVVFVLVATTLIVGKPMATWFSETQAVVSINVGWMFVLLMNVFLGFTLFLGFGKFGKIRLGGQDAKPEFKMTSWFAMLFSAGMGIGLLFWGVAEPIFHFDNNPFAMEGVSSAKSAMGVTFLHWGFHAWAVYAIVGLALAYFTFNKKLPLTIRSVFYPLFGEKIYGPIGDIIDIVSVIATLFGLATSLGFGVQQVNAGLTYLFDVEYGTTWQIGLISVITLFATLSLILGLDKGIRRLSEINMRLALLLLFFVLLIGPTAFLLKSFVQNLGYYLSNFMELSFWTESYIGAKEGTHWQNSWTIFYWAWWIAWSPFVGIFIARISKGRTIREFVLGVLFVPALLTFLWISVFGGSAIYQELLGNTQISEAVNANIATAIYHLLEQYPLPFVSSLLTVILVACFFVTSSDSGSMVVDTLTTGGKLDAPVGQKIFWASMEGLIAIVLLIGGGLAALQTATILTGLPFAIVLLIMCYSLLKTLKNDKVIKVKES
ncbi:BCCT family transporter [Marinifilum sp. D737]|uniref:BCCT family transporter n=1 Tax=Marinifilum sp. D737 TaxID=2969628 RepID=UPI0022741B19|nr:BCCT family transporter [Marinifilum sp. D737]MCY1635199.1 BCCT family transporter [Marinifilum sp. D737]